MLWWTRRELALFNFKEKAVAVVDITNGSIRSLRLPRTVTDLLITELGWHRPLDVLIFLRHVYDHRAESRASNIQAIECKLIRTPGFGKARTKKVVEALIANDII